MAVDIRALELNCGVVDGSDSSQASNSKKQGIPLPEGFVPGNYDVICAKGKAVANHVGNRRFRVIVRMHLQKYSLASSKQQKSRIVSAIVDSVRKASSNGGFVKLDPLTGRWYEVGDHLAREKVGQTLRDSLHTKYSSSTMAKKKRRQAEKAKERAMMAAQEESLQQYIASTSNASNQELRPDEVQQTGSADDLLDIFFCEKHMKVLQELNSSSEPCPTMMSVLAQPVAPNIVRGKAA